MAFAPFLFLTMLIKQSNRSLPVHPKLSPIANPLCGFGVVACVAVVDGVGVTSFFFDFVFVEARV